MNNHKKQDLFKDHRELSREMELFMSLDVAPGAPVLLENGLILYRELSVLMREYLSSLGGFQEVRAPALLKSSLWEQSGHLEKFSDDMYLFESGAEQLGLKPMNCPVHMLLYSARRRSYRELPYRIHDEGILHRREASGSLVGLARLMQFHQDDSHIFVTPEQLEEELQRCLGMIEAVYKCFGFRFRACLSSRPEGYLGELSMWDRAEKCLGSAMTERGIEFSIDVGGGAFYGPKIGIEIMDSVGRWWQLATVQLDFNLPERFDLSFVDSNGESRRPIVLHLALYGAIERFMAIYLEHVQGNLPIRLAPQQVRVYPVADRHQQYAKEVGQSLKDRGVRVMVDSGKDSLNARLRAGRVYRAPYSLVVGDEEVDSRLVAVSRRGVKGNERMSVERFLSEFAFEGKMVI
jgi:threonyl-tRNA synthetase